MQATREQYLSLKLFGLAGRMRKYQKLYFNNRMEYDKKQALKYERLLDDFIKLLLRDGWEPIFEDDKQSKLF